MYKYINLWGGDALMHLRGQNRGLLFAFIGGKNSEPTNNRVLNFNIISTIFWRALNIFMGGKLLTGPPIAAPLGNKIHKNLAGN